MGLSTLGETGLRNHLFVYLALTSAIGRLILEDNNIRTSSEHYSEAPALALNHRAHQLLTHTKPEHIQTLIKIYSIIIYIAHPPPQTPLTSRPSQTTHPPLPTTNRFLAGLATRKIGLGGGISWGNIGSPPTSYGIVLGSGPLVGGKGEWPHD